jgi:hypothetical protein
MGGISTTPAASAVQSLTNQAISGNPGTKDNISSAMNTIIANVSNNTTTTPIPTPIPTPTPTPTPTPAPILMTPPPVVSQTQNAIQAVQVLANMSASADATPVSTVAPIANVAISSVSTPAGLQAVQALATQSNTASAGTNANISAAVDIAVADITSTAQIQNVSPATSASVPAPSSGCYPLRNYDMSKVNPMIDGKWSFEDWQNFQPSLSNK